MKKTILALAGLSLVLATSVSAKPGAYLGASLGAGFLEGAKSSGINAQGFYTYNKYGIAVLGRVNAGYRFENNFGFELGYNNFSRVKSKVNGMNFSSSQKSFDLLGTYSYLICDSKFTVDGGLGAAYKVTDYNFNAPGYYAATSDSNKVVSGTFMLGLSYSLLSNVDIAAQYRYWSRANNRTMGQIRDGAQAVLLGLAYNF